METKDYIIGGVAVASLAIGIANRCESWITNKKLKSLETYVGTHTIVTVVPVATEQPVAEAVQAEVVQ